MGRLRGHGSASFRSTGDRGNENAVEGGSSSGYGDTDVAKLKEAIQSLCQSTNPLGEPDTRRMVMDILSPSLSLVLVRDSCLQRIIRISEKRCGLVLMNGQMVNCRLVTLSCLIDIYGDQIALVAQIIRHCLYHQCA